MWMVPTKNGATKTCGGGAGGRERAGLRTTVRGAAAALLLGAAAGVAGCSGEPPQGGPIPVKVSLGGLGDSPGRFMYPRAIAADEADGALWVVDKSARIQRIDPETGECLAFWRMPLSQTGKPVGITLGPTLDGKPGVWIPDTHYHRVMVFERPDAAASAPGGVFQGEVQPVTVFGEMGEGPGQFIYPTDIALLLNEVGRVERIYVGEYGGNDRVSVFDDQAQYLFSFGAFGYGGAEARQADGLEPVLFDRPQALTIDSVARELIVVDARNHRIGRFTLDGELIAWIGSPETAGAEAGQLRYPYGVTLLGDGTAMVAEYGNNRLQRLDLRTGESLGVWGVPGRGDGELASPWAVTTLGRYTFVLDSGNNRVLGMATPSLLNRAHARSAGLAPQGAVGGGG